jgi:hypothetical protein
MVMTELNIGTNLQASTIIRTQSVMAISLITISKIEKNINDSIDNSFL